MTDIFDEVQEDVRKERFEQLWKKYGSYAVAGAVAVVLAVGGYRGWQAWERSKNEEASNAYLAAQELAQSGNLVRAEGAFAKIAEEAPSGYATVARFTHAAVLLTENKREAALVILRDLMSTDDVVLASAARIQIGWVLADFAPKNEVQSTVAPLLAPDNPFRFSASEIMAYTALRVGARDEAVATFDKLGKDAGAPDGLRQRAAAIAEYLKANPDIRSLPTATAPPVLPLTPTPVPAHTEDHAEPHAHAAPAASVSAPVSAPEASPQ